MAQLIGKKEDPRRYAANVSGLYAMGGMPRTAMQRADQVNLGFGKLDQKFRPLPLRFLYFVFTEQAVPLHQYLMHTGVGLNLGNRDQLRTAHRAGGSFFGLVNAGDDFL